MTLLRFRQDDADLQAGQGKARQGKSSQVKASQGKQYASQRHTRGNACPKQSEGLWDLVLTLLLFEGPLLTYSAEPRTDPAKNSHWPCKTANCPCKSPHCPCTTPCCPLQNCIPPLPNPTPSTQPVQSTHRLQYMAHTLLETVVLKGGATKLDTASPGGTQTHNAGVLPVSVDVPLHTTFGSSTTQHD